MKKSSLALAAVAFSFGGFSVSGVANAAEASDLSGFYIGGSYDIASGGVDSNQKRDFTDAGASNVGSKLTIDKLDGFDIIAGFEPVNMNGLRLELSYGQLSGDDDYDTVTGAGLSAHELEFEGDYDISKFEFTGIKEFDIGNPTFKPFILGGIGYYDAELRYSSSSEPVVGLDTDHSNKKASESAVGFTLGAGVAFSFNERVGADISYRYTDTGVSFDKNDFADTNAALEHSKLDVDELGRFSASVRYKF